MNAKKLYALALNPWVVIGSLAAGFAVGMMAPAFAVKLGFIGDVYVDLLKMITLPFMVSAVIFSLQRLFREGGTGKLLGRVVVVFLAFSAVVAILGALTLLIMRPGTQGFHPAILLSVVNAIVYALFNLLTRTLAASDPPAVTNMLSAVGAVVLIAPFALSAWVTPSTAQQWLLIAFTGLAGGGGHLCLAHAHRFAPASALAPFLYQQIVYMILLGFLIYGDVPATAVLTGASIVIASGFYLLLRERRGR